MKSKLVSFLNVILLLSCLIAAVQCKKKPIKGCMDSQALNYDAGATEEDGSCEYEFQGPVNPGFESSGSWSGYGNFGRYTNTAFMPTQGIAYMQISPYFTGCSSTASAGIYQDNVYLNRSQTLTFDYSYSGTVTGTGICSDSILKITINVLFTSNGTSTLWSKTISSPATPYSGIAKIDLFEKSGETVYLPQLPDKGRLTFQVLVDILHNKPQGSQPSLESQGNLKFLLDNIRVQ